MTVKLLRHQYGEVTPARPIGPVEYRHFDLLAVHRGGIWLRIGKREQRLHGGQAVLIYPGTRFEGGVTGPVAEASVQHFALRAATGMPMPLRRLMGQTNSFELYESPPPGWMDHDVMQAMRLARLPESALLRDTRVAHLAFLLGRVRVEQSGGQLLTAQFEEWVRGELANIQVAELAAYCELSPSHFRDRFRREAGVSAGAYLQRVRLSEAARLLAETTLPVKEIASRVGYTEVPNFHRAFKAHQGVPPAAYRRAHRWPG